MAIANTENANRNIQLDQVTPVGSVGWFKTNHASDTISNLTLLLVNGLVMRSRRTSSGKLVFDDECVIHRLTLERIAILTPSAKRVLNRRLKRTGLTIRGKAPAMQSKHLDDRAILSLMLSDFKTCEMYPLAYRLAWMANQNNMAGVLTCLEEAMVNGTYDDLVVVVDERCHGYTIRKCQLNPYTWSGINRNVKLMLFSPELDAGGRLGAMTIDTNGNRNVRVVKGDHVKMFAGMNPRYTV